MITGRFRWSRLGLAAGVLAVCGCATVAPPAPSAPPAPPAPSEGVIGLASWYGPRHQGRPTAAGRTFDMHALTAAHRTLPLGSRARVTNLENGRTVVVRITDRGPYVAERVIDLSYAAAEALGMLERGVARVRIEPLAAGD